MGIWETGDWRTTKLAQGATEFVHDELTPSAQRIMCPVILVSVVHDHSLVYGTLVCDFVTIFNHMHIQCHFFFHLQIYFHMYVRMFENW